MDKREIRQMMELLQIEDVTTKRQLKNGTITWRLPIKIGSGNRNIEVGSFKSGYVRNNNCGYSNYQLNKRCEGEPEYFPVYKWVGDKQVKTDKYRKWTTRGCILIPNELDRLEYLIKYCVKNYYIKNANQVANGEYVHKSQHKWELEQSKKRNEETYYLPREVIVTVDGHRYKVQ